MRNTEKLQKRKVRAQGFPGNLETCTGTRLQFDPGMVEKSLLVCCMTSLRKWSITGRWLRTVVTTTQIASHRQAYTVGISILKENRAKYSLKLVQISSRHTNVIMLYKAHILLIVCIRSIIMQDSAKKLVCRGESATKSLGLPKPIWWHVIVFAYPFL